MSIAEPVNKDDDIKHDFELTEFVGGKQGEKPPPLGKILRDVLWGAAMALCVALVPNTITLLKSLNPISLGGADKLSLVSLLAFGAASVSLLMFGSGGIKAQGSSRWRAFGYPVLLIISGIAAAAYFIVVTGIGSSNGFGAGLAEALDSSLAPCIYLLWVAFALKQERISRIAVGGVLLVLIGLFVVGMAPVIRSQGASLSPLQSSTGKILVCFGLLGATGSAFSLWLLRSLVRTFGASLGFAVMLRYGGVAIAFLLGSLWTIQSGANFNVSLKVCILAFALGAVLINGAYFAAIRIESEISTVAAMASIPLLTFAVEGIMHAVLGLELPVDFKSPYMWMGVSSATVGIVLLQMRR
jgi:drug/metabolite transporter (DMT)-like permease